MRKNQCQNTADQGVNRVRSFLPAPDPVSIAENVVPTTPRTANDPPDLPETPEQVADLEVSSASPNQPMRSTEDPAEPAIIPDDLPPFPALSSPSFTWGDIDGRSFCSRIDEVYEKIVHWRRNLFQVPRGKAGEDFVTELARLLDGYSAATAMECIALKAAMVLPSLLLQRPHA